MFRIRQLIFFSIGLIYLFSCDKEKVEIDEVQDLALSATLSLKESWNTASIAIDLSNHLYENKDLKIIPPGANIEWIDSLFTDGDGTEIKVNFGPLVDGDGLLCLDGFKRAGILLISYSVPLSMNGSRVEVIADTHYFSGSLTQLRSLQGGFNLNIDSLNSLNIGLEGKFSISAQNTQSIRASIKRNTAFTEYLISQGDLTGSTFERSDFFSFKLEDILVSFKFNCVNRILEGKLESNGESNSKDLSIDFNPYQDQSCDELAKWNWGHTENIYYYY